MTSFTPGSKPKRRLATYTIRSRTTAGIRSSYARWRAVPSSASGTRYAVQFPECYVSAIPPQLGTSSVDNTTHPLANGRDKLYLHRAALLDEVGKMRSMTAVPTVVARQCRLTIPGRKRAIRRPRQRGVAYI